MPANLENSAVATGQERSVFIPIPKKGNAKECSNYCTIALISHASKVMLKILQARLQQYVNHEKTPGFLASGEEFSSGPETKLDCSELLCNKVLLKYKGNRESFWHRHQKGEKEYPLASVSSGVIYAPMNQKTVWWL